MTQMRCVGVVEPAPGASNITDVINDVISRPILPNGSPGQGDCCVLSQAKPNISSLLSLTDSGQWSRSVVPNSGLHVPHIVPGHQYFCWVGRRIIRRMSIRTESFCTM